MFLFLVFLRILLSRISDGNGKYIKNVGNKNNLSVVTAALHHNQKTVPALHSPDTSWCKKHGRVAIEDVIILCGTPVIGEVAIYPDS